ncbi:RrF2 family transcriptional regulator [Limobrevibacterium gyesilva]|uniref:Rrf2 family transcriptional regulator n=1 Tax=Limobrevibacterium gyesilva TaxID=2991712 RepID=A0AA41YN75_9PROT|nr:Rrf2 family transcriptional regulator [Limobrevibacterium gyesilva]MCW3475153.1 Rrf2 family transcriptional regulator [Limobrevibacterium gyesilva]
MRLTAFTDYSLRALMYLAAEQPGRENLARIADIAAAYGISEAHLTKVVYLLAQGGEIETIRGRNGGLRLGRPPDQINLGQLIRRTEPDLTLVECFDGGACRVDTACALKHVLHEALDAFLAVLDRYTLADLMAPRRDIAALLGLTPGRGSASRGLPSSA